MGMCELFAAIKNDLNYAKQSDITNILNRLDATNIEIKVAMKKAKNCAKWWSCKLGKRKKKCEDESNTTYTGRDCSARDFRDEFKTLTHWRSLHSKNKGVRDSLIKIIQGVEVVGARA